MANKNIIKQVLLILLISNTCFLFGQIRFNKNVGIGNRTDMSYSVFVSDTGYITAGTCEIGTTSYYLGTRFVYYNLDGEIITDKQFSLPISHIYRPWNNCVKKVNDGFIWHSTYTDTTYLSGYEADVIFIKYDENADTIWKKVFSFNDYDSSFGVEQTHDGGFVGAGYSYISFAPNPESCCRLVKLDSLGNLLWSYTYNCDYAASLVSVTVLPDGCIVGGGQIQENNQFSYKNSLVIKTDSVGNLKWTKQLGGPYDEYSVYVTKTQDGNILATGSYCFEQEETSPPGYCTKQKLYMAKLDSSDGHVIWEKKYGGYSPGTLVSCEELSDGSIIAVGAKLGLIAPNTWKNLGCLLKTDENGDSLWYRQYYYTYPDTVISNYNELYSVKQTPDGGYVACGQIYGNPGHGQDSWLIKTDEYGCLVPDCNLIGIDELDDDDFRLFIYPNPAQNFVTVKLPINYNKASLQIINMQGQIVKNIALLGNGSQTIETTDLPSGIYQLLVYSNNKSLIGHEKLIIVTP